MKKFFALIIPIGCFFALMTLAFGLSANVSLYDKFYTLAEDVNSSFGGLWQEITTNPLNFLTSPIKALTILVNAVLHFLTF